ncbi:MULTISPECIES: hypothetical protein [Alcanivorax]|uniref:hypothetical protein n=1 Tax=Alcanivorax TaxID=59753 RepID=UPI0025BB3850|nr:MULTISPECIES: hypothetical protein [Alcanivorax]MCK5885961.1 hypothetical protein [Alcanivorax sp.]
MEVLNESYIRLSEAVNDDNKILASENLSLFGSKILNKNKRRIDGHFSRLAELDREYQGYLRPRGAINDLNMRNAQLGILTLSRKMAVDAIGNYETAISGFDAGFKFQISSTIAFLAFLISVLGLIF